MLNQAKSRITRLACVHIRQALLNRPFYDGLLLLFLAAAFASAQEHKTNFFLPSNPVAAAYVLSRLSNQELIAAPRGEFVYVALLQRAGIERKFRVEALEGLAKLRHTSVLGELLNGLAELDEKGDDSIRVLRDLLPILLQTAPAELSERRTLLEKLSGESQLALTRQIGWAALVTADRSINPAWKQAKPEQIPDLLLAIPLISDAALRTACYPKVEPLVAERFGVRQSSAAFPLNTTNTSSLDLAALVQAGIQRSTAIASLEKIPRKAWPKESILPLAGELVEYLKNVPADGRAETDFSDALQFATELASSLSEEKAQPMTRILRGLGPAVFLIRTVYEQMRYDKRSIAVEAGKPVAISLQNEDAMPHNLAILMPGALEEIGLAAEKMSSEPDAAGRLYVPASAKLLQATKLVPPGERTLLVFTAPEQPGDYPYVCTFPGHWRVMGGTMTVVRDLDVYLASHADSKQPAFTEWKLEDLTPELSKASYGRDLQSGKELFTKLACIQCHKLGHDGYLYGPDLTDVFARYKNDRTNVLQQILEPSKVIADRYRNFSFELKNSEPVTGMVLKEDAETITIQSGPADSLIQTLKKSEIQQRRPQISSPMPLGLLNSLSKEQILDLLAYIESGGVVHTHEHGH